LRGGGGVSEVQVYQPRMEAQRGPFFVKKRIDKTIEIAIIGAVIYLLQYYHV